MELRRMGWAGIELTAPTHLPGDSGTASLVIDLVRDAALLRAALPAGELDVEDWPRADAALITHLHADHADVAAIADAVGLGGTVYRPEPFSGSAAEAAWTSEQEAALSASGLDARVLAPWQRVTVGPFAVTAVPAVDGLGDPQLNWVVEAGGQRVFHGGDTMFHGYWWLIAGRCGPIDVAVLPVNGAIVHLPHLRPASGLPAALTPEQAAAAAVALGAGTVVPMHFGIDQPPFYVEADDAVERLRAALPPEVGVSALSPGERLAVTA